MGQVVILQNLIAFKFCNFGKCETIIGCLLFIWQGLRDPQLQVPTLICRNVITQTCTSGHYFNILHSYQFYSCLPHEKVQTKMKCVQQNIMNGALCSVNSEIVFMHIPNWQLLALELKSVSVNIFVIFCAPYHILKK